MIILMKMDIPPLPVTPSPSSLHLGTKPVPLPRRTSPSLVSSGRESPHNNIPSSPVLPHTSSHSGDPPVISSSEAIYANECNAFTSPGLSKPVPLPRKLVQRLTSSASSTSSSSSSTTSEISSPASCRSQTFLSNPTVEEQSDEDSLDYESIPSKPNQIVNEKTGTINIFKLANTIDDPFDTDFEKSIKDGEIHTTSELSFSSPLNELDDESRRRFSTLSSYSSSTSTTNTSEDSSDHYMEPPPARPISSDLAAAHILASLNGRRFSNLTTGSRNSSFPKPIKEEDNEFESFDELASTRGSTSKTNHTKSPGGNKLPLTKVASCPPAPSTATDDSTYEPVSNNLSPGSSSPSRSSISRVNFISSSSNQMGLLSSSPTKGLVGHSSQQNASHAQLPSNPNFSQAKRITVPNVEKPSSSSNIKQNGFSLFKSPTSQDSNANVNDTLGLHRSKFESKNNFDTGEFLKSLRGTKDSSSSSRSSETSTNTGGGSNWSLSALNKEDTSSPMKRRSLASLTESTDSFGSFDRTRVALRRTSSNRSNTSIRGGKKIHEYDDVAIEDGNVILLNTESNDASDHSTSSLNHTGLPIGGEIRNPLRSNSTESSGSSSLTSRNSVVAEFDPLMTLTPTTNGGHSSSKPTLTAVPSLPSKGSSKPQSSIPDEADRISSLHLNEEQQHRYEYIDTDAEEDSDRRASSSTAASSSSNNLDNHYSSLGKRESEPNSSKTALGNLTAWENPEYFPAFSVPPATPKRETFQVMKFPQGFQAVEVADEQYEPIAAPPEGSMRLNNLSLTPPTKPERRSPQCMKNVPPNVPSPTSSQEDNVDGSRNPDSPETSPEPPSFVPPAQPNSSGILSQNSFFRRFSNKLKLNSIREENSGISTATQGPFSSTMSIGGTTKCKKCQWEHSPTDHHQCKYSPVLRPDVVFSSNLYKPSSVALGRKDFPKKRVVLKDAKLKFLNEKSEVASEIPVERICAISRRDDHKVNTNLPDLKYFELFLVNQGKSSSSSAMVLAGGNESDRDSWMRKYIETYTTSIPLSIISSYQRGGWTFMKEAVTSEWNLSVMVLKDRQLYISYQGTGEYFEMDLRKARSIVLSQKDDEHKCPFVDNQEVLTIDCITKILYVQTESGKATGGWEKAVKAAASFNGTKLHEMQLTHDNVPVIVDKCIDFLYAHGTLAEGIYRQSGSNTRITQLLSEFQKDAWGVTLSHKDYSAHDVAGTLKRFFRTLPEPLVTSSLYKEWIKAQNMTNPGSKKTEYLRLLETLPRINYNILKKLICHLNAVHELRENNLMPLVNLAPIWGPTLMNVDSSSVARTYDTACWECEVVKDLIENYYELFRVDSQEIAREKKMQDALENFHLGSCKRKHSGDMKIWIYLWDKDESSAHNVTLTPQSTAHTIVHQICTKHQIRSVENLSIHEVICQNALERPLHPSEKVIETVLRWSIWDIDERKDNYLILKRNTFYPTIADYAKESRSLSGELKYADSKSKSFRKCPFTFNQGVLRCSKDTKGLNELGSWKVEDIVWYTGCESKRTPPTKWTFTFVKRNTPYKRGKDEPFFGNVISFNSEDELQKWWGSMIVTLHPEGLSPSVMI